MIDWRPCFQDEVEKRENHAVHPYLNGDYSAKGRMTLRRKSSTKVDHRAANKQATAIGSEKAPYECTCRRGGPAAHSGAINPARIGKRTGCRGRTFWVVNVA